MNVALFRFDHSPLRLFYTALSAQEMILFYFAMGGWNPLAAEEVDAGADSVCGFNGGFARFCFAAVGIEHSANQPSVNHLLCPFLSSVF